MEDAAQSSPSIPGSSAEPRYRDVHARSRALCQRPSHRLSHGRRLYRVVVEMLLDRLHQVLLQHAMSQPLHVPTAFSLELLCFIPFGTQRVLRIENDGTSVLARGQPSASMMEQAHPRTWRGGRGQADEHCRKNEYAADPGSTGTTGDFIVSIKNLYKFCDIVKAY